jgi:hypothetical protein
MQRMDDGGPAYTDVHCTICGRHNRIAHMVGLTEGVRVCSVCVGKVGAIMDAEAGVVGPAVDWPSRWPLKRPDEAGP